jgi:DNA-directed RNA polymerase alpha subunit
MSAQSDPPGVRDLDGLSLRTMHYRALANFGLLTKTAIAEMSERDLLRLPRLGPTAVATIKRELARHGLALRSDLVSSRERPPYRAVRAHGAEGEGKIS